MKRQQKRRTRPRHRHGTGSFGVRHSALIDFARIHREDQRKARARLAPHANDQRTAWGSGSDIECLTRRMNATGSKRAARALICAEYRVPAGWGVPAGKQGVPNTGRQWRKIRKAERHSRRELVARKRANVQRRAVA